MGRWRTVLVALAVAVGLSGCAVTRQGKLSVPGEDRSIPATVSLGGSSADITAFDPVTGERFSGSLREEPTTQRAAGTAMMGPPVGGGPAPIGAEGAASALLRETMINLTGALRGDRGTELRCVLQIEKRALIKGAGTCRPADALDDEGRIYQLSF
jgi:hypothetical protein